MRYQNKSGSEVFTMNKFQLQKERFCSFVKEKWSDSRPLMKLFRTDHKGYVYDTGTNKIIECDEPEYMMIKNLRDMNIQDALELSQTQLSNKDFLKALENIQSGIEKKNLFCTKKADQFGLSAHFSDLYKVINNYLGMIQLEVTEKCNLRCRYCVYDPTTKGKRNHGNRDMSLDIAFKAIDLLERYSKHKDEVVVTFYGGEPLLRFSFIKSCIEYSKRKLKGKKRIGFSITTNGTLITKKMADYFAEEGVSFNVSIDGPKEIHDSHRKDIFGKGSFEKSIVGLRKLFDSYGKNSEKISLSMVYTPPFSERRIQRILDLWNEYKWIPLHIPVNITYPLSSPEVDKSFYKQKIDMDSSLWKFIRNKFMKDYKKNEKSYPIASHLIERDLAYLFKRPIYSKPENKYHLNGCCIPGARKLFVELNGTLRLCERILDAPALGDVINGIDVDSVRKNYVNEYAEKSLPMCSECWALNLCKICYIHAFKNGRFDSYMKEMNCRMIRIGIEENLKLYCQLLEINENGLDYLSNYEIV